MYAFLRRAAAFSALCLSFSGLGEALARFPVIGYFPSWQGTVANVQFDKVTHLNYSFVQVGADGAVTLPNDGLMLELVQRAHAAGAKVGLAVGGWNGGNTSGFDGMAASSTARARFIKELFEIIDYYSLDGVDIDWEYPTAYTAANFATMMKELGAALKARGKYLSAAVITKDNYYGAHVRAEVFAALDFLNIMCYDWTQEANHSSYALAQASLAYWVTTRGCPREKAILGLPFYARSVNGGDQYVAYSTLIAQDPANAQRDVAGGLYYNGIPTIQSKVQLAYEKGGGVMFWETSQDAGGSLSLLTAIDAKAKTFPAAIRAAHRANGGRLAASAPGRLRFEAALPGTYVLRITGMDGRLAVESRASGSPFVDFAWGRRLGAGPWVYTVEGEGLRPEALKLTR